MDSDRRTAATEDDRVDVDGGRLQDRPDHVLGELVEGEQLALGRGRRMNACCRTCLCSCVPRPRPSSEIIATPPPAASSATRPTTIPHRDVAPALRPDAGVRKRSPQVVAPDDQQGAPLGPIAYGRISATRASSLWERARAPSLSQAGECSSHASTKTTPGNSNKAWASAAARSWWYVSSRQFHSRSQ